MKTKLLGVMLLAGSSLFAETRFSIGIGVGGYGYAPPPVVAYRPACPGPGYEWVNGYWYEGGHRRLWRDGYWARQSYSRGYDRYRYEGDRYRGNRYNDDRSYRNDYRGNNYYNNYNNGRR
jgi:WXXGXW repeat (2 copies)